MARSGGDALGPGTAPRSGGAGSDRPAPAPWLSGTAAFLFALPWSVVVLPAYEAVPAIPFGVTLVVGTSWDGAVLFVFARWTSSPTWGRRDRFAVVGGGIVACMVGGFAIFAVGGAGPIDRAGKAVLDAGAGA